MPGLRVIIIIAVVIAVIFLLRQVFSSSRSLKQSRKQQERVDSGHVVACSRCGVHVPSNEIKKIDGQDVCRECRQ